MTDKRDRGKNFTESEKEHLINICLRHKDVIENKRTDKLNVKLKNEIWQKIQEDYNVVQTTGFREVRALKTLYDNLKMKARREQIEDKISSLSSRIVTELGSQLNLEHNAYDSSSSNSSFYNFVENVAVVDDGEANDDIKENSIEDADIKVERLLVMDEEETNIPRKRTKLQNDYDKLPDVLEDRSKVSREKLDMLRAEHRRRMEILDIEKEIAHVKLRNALKKQRLLELQLKKLQ